MTRDPTDRIHRSLICREEWGIAEFDESLTEAVEPDAPARLGESDTVTRVDFTSHGCRIPVDGNAGVEVSTDDARRTVTHAARLEE